jgi:hypothetical protein
MCGLHGRGKRKARKMKGFSGKDSERLGTGMIDSYGVRDKE